MADKMVTIATFSHGIQAQVARAKLESEGIFAFLADDNMVTMNWLYSNAIGGVRLQVKESDAERSARILQTAPERQATLTDSGSNCPECDPANVSYHTFALRPLFISWAVTQIIQTMSALLLLPSINSIPLPFVKRKWKWQRDSCGLSSEAPSSSPPVWR